MISILWRVENRDDTCNDELMSGVLIFDVMPVQFSR